MLKINRACISNAVLRRRRTAQLFLVHCRKLWYLEPNRLIVVAGTITLSVFETGTSIVARQRDFGGAQW